MATLILRLLPLTAGRVLFEGTPAEVKVNAAVREAYLGGLHGAAAA